MQGSIRFPKYENENPKYFLTQNPKYFSKVTAKFKINFQKTFFDRIMKSHGRIENENLFWRIDHFFLHTIHDTHTPGYIIRDRAQDHPHWVGDR